MAVPLNILRWLPVILVTGALAILASVPGSALPNFLHHGVDKITHAFVYGLLAASYLYGFGPLRVKYPHRINIITSLICFIYAFSEEWYQQFIPGRISDRLDLQADIIGFLSVITAWFLITHFKKRIP
jgi:VanZ family protein